MHHLQTENTLKTMKKLSKDNVGHIIRQPYVVQLDVSTSKGLYMYMCTW